MSLNELNCPMCSLKRTSPTPLDLTHNLARGGSALYSGEMTGALKLSWNCWSGQMVSEIPLCTSPTELWDQLIGWPFMDPRSCEWPAQWGCTAGCNWWSSLFNIPVCYSSGQNSSQTVAPSVSHNQVQRDVNITTHIHGENIKVKNKKVSEWYQNNQTYS